MPLNEQATHKSGVFKQSNKGHKTGGHRTKSQIKSLSKGKTDSISVVRLRRKFHSKDSRRNDVKLRRSAKRDAALARKRLLGTAETPPFLVTVISLCESTDPHEILGGLLACDSESTSSTSDSDLVFLSLPRFKQRMCFCMPGSDNLYEILDALKVSDTVMFIWPTDGQLSESSELVLSCVFAQGLPTSIHTQLHLDDPKHKASAKKAVAKTFEQWFTDSKMHTLSSDADYLNLCRTIGQTKKRTLVMQERRAHIVAESVQSIPTGEGLSSVVLTGYMRGPPLNVNHLLHISGWGDYQMSSIETLQHPHPLNKSKRNNRMESEDSAQIERADLTLQTDLVNEVTPDPMASEQTWPTAQEIKEAETNRRTRKVPKGTSEYQACWIVEESDEDDNDSEQSDEDSDCDDKMREVEVTDDEEEDGQSDKEETESIATELGENKYDEEMDTEMEKQQLDRFRKERENLMFPDEVDTPLESSARIRFQKYRGLKSFRTSPWDTRENLPYDYSRIFQFQNFNRSKNKVLKEEKIGVIHGSYVKIHVINVPTNLIENAASPLIAFGILPHEHKMSLINLVIRKHKSCSESVKSKDKLVFHVGFRRFTAKPVFSQHSTGDKHKLERYLPDEDCVVASMYAPICFPPAPVLVFGIDSLGVHKLVATGSLMDVKPSRVVVKRIVLSGHPFKINKRHSTVRYMFFNREDIMWFKPVQLRTKMGRRGHIKEPLGTHGHMKCTFDTQLSSMDTVLMNLYKRVFPKWNYDPSVPRPLPFRALSSAISMNTVESAAMDNS